MTATTVLPPPYEASFATSHYADLDGPVHWFDFGGPADAPLLLCVHGLGGGAWNWISLAQRLINDYRVIAIDLAGHGLTPAGTRTAAVPANRRLLDRFIREVIDEPVVLVGNSMGGLITVLESAAAPDVVQAAVLVDPALPRPAFSRIDPLVALQFTVAAIPGLGEALYRRARGSRTTRQQVKETLALCTVDRSRIDPEVVEAGVALLESRNADEFPPTDLIVAARSLVRVLTRQRRMYRTMRAITAPVLMLHGNKDRLVNVRVAQRVAERLPAWKVMIAENVGHVPMLEVPDWTADQVRAFLQQRLARPAS